MDCHDNCKLFKHFLNNHRKVKADLIPYNNMFIFSDIKRNVHYMVIHMHNYFPERIRNLPQCNIKKCICQFKHFALFKMSGSIK